jgi:hypothetical protein
MLQRRGTASQWSTANTVLAAGEIGFAYDTKIFKIGDGSTAWNSLKSISEQALPVQTSNTGKFLTTDGTAASWATVDLSTKQDKVTNVSDTEIGYLDGVTSSIQTQLNDKSTASKTETFTNKTLTSPKINEDVVLTATATELNYVDGVTSAIQTQLNAKSGLLTAEPSANTNTASSVGYIGMPQNILASGGLTLSKAHAGEHVYVTGSSQTITIPANSSVPFEIGTAIVIINGNVASSIAITTDTLRLAGSSLTGTRSLAAYGLATAVKVESTTWIVSGSGLT